jgi:tetratricopeptide (TPR) repeat protein
VLATYCQAHRSRTPFGAWLQPLRELFEIAGERPEEGRRKIKEGIARLRPELEMFAPLVADLLSLSGDEDGMVASLDAKARRQHLTETVVQVLGATAQEQPLMLLMEDVHWADSPSLELLGEVLSRLDRPIFIGTTSRKERPPPLAGIRPAVLLHLAELGSEEAKRLVGSAATLADDEVEAIVGKAKGNPLFLQEMARSGSGPGQSLPETIDDVVMARLDSLPHQERSLLRLASVIGPSFELAPLEALASRSVAVEHLDRTLNDLADRGFVVARGGRRHLYTFNHVLVQEVAYETLPFAQRRQMHRSFAGWIESEQAGRLEQAAEVLLHHFDLAGDARKTTLYAAMSGDHAASIFANTEAIAYYRRSLSALEKTRGGASDRSLVIERIADCLETSGTHAQAARTFLEALREWRDAAGKRPRLVPWRCATASREAALCRKAAVSYERNSDYDESMRWLDKALSALPRRSGRVGALVYGAKSVSLSRQGHFAEGIRWARRSLDRARCSGEPKDVAYAHNMLAGSYMDLGAPKRAIRHLRSAVRIYDEIGDLPGQASANNNLGMCCYFLGALDAALHHYQVALQADRRAGDMVDAAIAHNNIGEVLLALGRPEEAVAELEEAVGAHQLGADVSLSGLAMVNMCRARILQGDLDTAERLLRRGMRLMRTVGAEGLLTEGQLQLAELRLAQGRVSAAYRHCRSGLARAREAEARLLEARGERVLGMVLASLGKHEDARTHTCASIRLARSLGAGQEEARSLTALARLHVNQGAGTAGESRGALRRAQDILSAMGATLDLAEVHELQARIES